MSPLYVWAETSLQFWNELNAWGGINWRIFDPRFIPLIIFTLRTFNLTLSILRLLSVVRGRRLVAWVLALVQSFIYITTFAGLLSDITNPLSILAYAGGYATGNVLGMWVENRLAPGYNLLRITSSNFGTAILDALHQQGYGATELPGAGKEGTVSVIYSFVPRKSMASLKSSILSIDPQAFLTTLPVRQLRGGWLAQPSPLVGHSTAE
jgi:uncharacterized protein YebE (UPF0316 family)